MDALDYVPESDSDCSALHLTNSDQRKRKQVKRACSNCRKAHSACGKQRPCPRCISRKEEASCMDTPRKKRKIGSKKDNKNQSSFGRYRSATPLYKRPRYETHVDSDEGCSPSLTKRVALLPNIKTEDVDLGFTVKQEKVENEEEEEEFEEEGQNEEQEEEEDEDYVQRSTHSTVARKSVPICSRQLIRRKLLAGRAVVKIEPCAEVLESGSVVCPQSSLTHPEFLPLSNPLLAHLSKLDPALSSLPSPSYAEEPKFLFADEVCPTEASSCPSLSSSTDTTPAPHSPVSSPPYASSRSSMCTSPQPGDTFALFGLDAEYRGGSVAQDAPLDDLFSAWGSETLGQQEEWHNSDTSLFAHHVPQSTVSSTSFSEDVGWY